MWLALCRDKNPPDSVAAEVRRRKIINRYIIICIIADNEENVKMKIKICLCRKCGRRKAFYKSLGLCYCVSCYRRIYGEARD